MTHSRHGPFVYACNRHTFGSPNSAGENYASGFTLLSLLGLKPRKKLGRPKNSKDSYQRTRRF
jgi:hypothetical protein